MIYLKSIKLKDCSFISPLKSKLLYPFNSPAIRFIESFNFEKPVTFIIGENGCGKSTLLEALMTLYNERISYQGTREIFSEMISDKTESDIDLLIHQIELQEDSTPSDYFFFRAESFFNYALKIDSKARDELKKYPRSYILDSFGGHELFRQSHGESFLNTFLNYRERNTLFILDEPEGAISPQRQLTLLARIHQLAKQGCQLIIATHSPILIAYPGATIYQVDETGAHVTPYKETELYNFMRTFLGSPEVFMDEMF